MTNLSFNEVDLEHLREVTKEEGERFALRHGLQFCEVSAVEESDIETLFQRSLEEVLERFNQGRFSDEQSESSFSTYAPGSTFRNKAPPPPDNDGCAC